AETRRTRCLRSCGSQPPRATWMVWPATASRPVLQHCGDWDRRREADAAGRRVRRSTRDVAARTVEGRRAGPGGDSGSGVWRRAAAETGLWSRRLGYGLHQTVSSVGLNADGYNPCLLTKTKDRHVVRDRRP